MNHPHDKPSGVILAGGRARRFEGVAKALIPLAGRPMIEHVMARFQPQVRTMYLSVSEPNPSLAATGANQVVDEGGPYRGPLVGLLAVLRQVLARGSGPWLALAPCDAPFLPPDLVVTLLRRARAKGSPGVVVRYRGELQPTFSLWHTDLIASLQEAVEDRQMGGFKAFLDLTPLPELDWPGLGSDPASGAQGNVANPFFNVNSPEDLECAASMLSANQSSLTGLSLDPG